MNQTKRKPVYESTKRAIEYYARTRQDISQKRIAELTGVSERSVYRVLKEAGLLTHLPRMTAEEVKVQALLRIHGISYDKLKQMLEQNLSQGQMIKAITEMDTNTYLTFLTEAVTARVAKTHNVGVSTAMLNLQNAVDKNAKPGNN